MSLFEFVTVMISMILALCLGQLLRSVSYLAKTDQQVKWYLPYAMWMVVVLLTVINHWWSLWDLRNLDWSYVSFIYILVAPVLITFATGLMSPVRTSTGQIDLHLHFSRIRKLFGLVFAAYVIFMWFDGPLFTEQQVFGLVGMLHIPILAAHLITAFWDDRRWNIIAPGIVILMLLVIMALRYSGS